MGHLDKDFWEQECANCGVGCDTKYCHDCKSRNKDEQTNDDGSYTKWCELCQMTSYYSDNNQYGTCQCS
jgi:hypothetical protein